MGRETEQTAPRAAGLRAEDVASYLRAHPDFLIQHGELVSHLTPPSADRGGGVVDFQAFMVERLRGDLRRLKELQRELVATTRANLNSQNRVHAAVLFLLDAQSFEQLIQTVSCDLAVLLDLDVACLVVETSNATFPAAGRSEVRMVEPGTIAQWFGRRDTILRANIEGEAEIYGANAGLVRSDALLRLKISPQAPEGLLAFGSREPDMFHEGQGIELINFLARVVERRIRAWLEAPA